MSDPKNSPEADDDGFFPQTSKIIREKMEQKYNEECDDGDAINGAFFMNDD